MQIINGNVITLYGSNEPIFSEQCALSDTGKTKYRLIQIFLYFKNDRKNFFSMLINSLTLTRARL